jgi:SAM-dependent methyltransferase
MWNERYGGAGFYYGTEPNDFLREQSRLIPARASVLCLAEGEGRNAVYLASLGHRVTAVDFSEVALAKLADWARARGVTVQTICADLSRHELGTEEWDAIVSIWCHLPSRVRSALHSRIDRALRPNGLFILEAYTPKQIPLGTGGPKDPDLTPTAERLRLELDSVEILSLEEKRRDVSEGEGHRGPSEVVQLVARKRAQAG